MDLFPAPAPSQPTAAPLDVRPTHASEAPPAPSSGVPEDGIWQARPDLELANQISAGCVIGRLGIEFTEVGVDHLTARMPVDSRTHQPLGILHGGASVLLAETLVSWGATCAAEPGKTCVGMEINANHLRPVSSGWVIGTARPIALGRRSQVWEVRVVDDSHRLICVSRCTLAVIDVR